MKYDDYLAYFEHIKLSAFVTFAFGISMCMWAFVYIFILYPIAKQHCRINESEEQNSNNNFFYQGCRRRVSGNVEDVCYKNICIRFILYITKKC